MYSNDIYSQSKESTMKKLSLLLLVFASFLANASIEDELKALMLANLKATQSEDKKAVFATMHSQSPAKAGTNNMLDQIFTTYDLKYSILDFKYVAADETYAYARTKQLTEKVSGPAFNPNELESLVIFKQENGDWKLWTQAVLTIEFK